MYQYCIIYFMNIDHHNFYQIFQFGYMKNVMDISFIFYECSSLKKLTDFSK